MRNVEIPRQIVYYNLALKIDKLVARRCSNLNPFSSIETYVYVYSDVDYIMRDDDGFGIEKKRI